MIEYPPPQLPPLTLIRQAFPLACVADVDGELRAQLDASGVKLKPGGRYAIACGSRGIANYPRLVRGIIEWVKSRGASCFIVPAMGSHGGATAEGQTAVLASYGITEPAMGVPIVSSMDVVELPRGELEVPTWFDRHALSADGTILLNRVKMHTDYHGPVESGLMKMMVIGLGKHKQAIALHEKQIRGMVELLPQVARNSLRHNNVILGVGVVENACDQTAVIRAVPQAELPREDAALLELSRQYMPRLPVDDLDVLIIDRIGKDISGVCMDTNIIGRIRVYGFPEPQRPRIRIIVARDLTDASHGNAIGIGLADVTTRRLASKINWDATYENLITNTFLDRGKLPAVAETDAQALAIAWRAAGSPDPAAMRLIRIADTLHLEHMLVSPAVARELAAREGITAEGTVKDWLRPIGA